MGAELRRLGCAALQAGRSYVSDGKTHLMDFKVNGTDAGAAQLAKLRLQRRGQRDRDR